MWSLTFQLVNVEVGSHKTCCFWGPDGHLTSLLQHHLLSQLKLASDPQYFLGRPTQMAMWTGKKLRFSLTCKEVVTYM